MERWRVGDQCMVDIEFFELGRVPMPILLETLAQCVHTHLPTCLLEPVFNRNL